MYCILLSLFAPLLGTYIFPLGAVNASSGNFASINSFSGILFLASTNKGYNPSSLCTNSLYAFLIFLGVTKLLNPLLAISPTTGIAPNPNATASVPAAK